MKQGISNKFTAVRNYGSLCLSLVGALVILLANCVNTRADTSSGLVAYLPLDETDSLTAPDASGNGHTGYLSNFLDSTSEWVTGITNNALALNLTLDPTNGTYWPIVNTNYERVVLADPSNALNFSTMTAPAFTLAAWVRGATNLQGAVHEPSGAGVINVGGAYVVDMYADRFRFFVFDGSAKLWTIQQKDSDTPGGQITASDEPPSSNNISTNWQLVVGVYDSTQPPDGRMKLYLNGQLLAHLTNGPTTLYNITAPTVIGARIHDSVNGYDLPFMGTIDDVRFYNRALSSNDVWELYNFTNSPPIPTAPQITVEPAGGSITAENPFSLTAGASGTAPLSPQWYLNGNPIAGATNFSFSIPYIQPGDAGNYTVVITNAYGSVTSTPPAVVTVTPLPPADLSSDLLFHYTFDETSGSTAHDTSGNAYDATLYNWGVGEPEWGSGIIGGALRFNAGAFTNNYVETPYSIVYNDTTNFTFTFWAKLGPELYTNTINPRIFATADSQPWIVDAQSGTPYGIDFWHGDTGTPPTTNAWHQYIVVFNRAASRYTIYVNGVREVIGGIPSNPATLNDPTYFPWIIGHDPMVTSPDDMSSFRGWLDDVRLYNRQFNWNDAMALYQSGVIASSNTTLLPALTVTPNANQTVTLSWPAWASDFVLQGTGNLATGPWTNVTATPFLNGVSRYLTNSVGSQGGYYRLHYAP